MSLPNSFAAEGIQLRRLHLSDAPALCAAYRRSEADLDPSVVATDTIERACAAIAAFDRAFESGTYVYGVFDRDTLVGCVSLQPSDPRAFHVGVWIDAASRRHGFAMRGVCAMTAIAFERLSADRTELRIEPTNTTMRRIADRAGYELVTTLPAWSFDPHGARRDQCVYRLDADGYRRSVLLEEINAARSKDDFEVYEWMQLVEQLHSRHDVVRADGPEVVLAVAVTLAHEPHVQHVVIERRRVGDAPWLMVRSTIGPPVLDAAEALAHNATIAAGAIALVGDCLVIRHGLPPAAITFEGLAHIVALVAHEAARLRMIRRAIPEPNIHAFAAFVD